MGTFLPTRNPGVREAALAFLAFAVLGALEIVVSGSVSLIGHPMWLDECVSSLVLNDPSFRHMMAAIRGGAETNGPGFYVLWWPVARAVGGLSTTGLRILTALTMIAGFTGVYVACRAVVGPGRAFIGGLVVSAHPVTLVLTWQARMYGTWFAAAAWFCAYTVHAGRNPSPWRIAVGCALAVLLVTAHWFGLPVLIIVSVAAIANRRGRGASGSEQTAEQATVGARNAPVRAHVLPLVAGCVTLLVCAPLLAGQRAALTVPTWLDPIASADVALALRQMFGVVPLLVVVGFALDRLVRRDWLAAESADIRRVAPVLWLLLFPVVLVVFSLVVQPSLLERYLIPTIVPIGVVAALVATSTTTTYGRIVGAVGAILLVAISCLELRGLSAVTNSSDARIANAISVAERHAVGDSMPILFARRFEDYPVVQERPRLAERVALLDFDGAPRGVTRLALFERDLGRATMKYYPAYRVVNVRDLERRGPFIVVDNSADEIELRRILFGFRVWMIGPDEFYVQFHPGEAMPY